jgi:hypothetical protein
MRYRRLDPDGDYVFGGQQADFHRDTPEGVAQAVATRLRLMRGEWFLDQREGMPWQTEVLGKLRRGLHDSAIRQRILATPGVTSLSDYSSVLDTDTRALSVSVRVTTVYGNTTVQATL